MHRSIATLWLAAVGSGAACGGVESASTYAPISSGSTSDGDDDEAGSDGFGTEGDTGDDGASSSGLTTDSVGYALTWRWDRATPVADGWSVVNDLGWTVEVDEGWVVDYAISLVPCASAFVGPDALPTGPRAEQGHGGFTDPSAYDDPRTESLVTLEGLTYDPLAVYAVPYCDAHWLTARADDSVAEPDAEGLSLHVAGWVTAPGETDAQRFDLISTWADGTVMPLPMADDQQHAEAITVIVERDLDTLFDGVDFTALLEEGTEESVGQQILTNLTDHATVSVRID